jgi:hypothetical protein
MMMTTTRRALLAGLMAAGLASAGAHSPSQAATGPFRVDNRYLLSIGGGRQAEEMRVILEAALVRAFAGQPLPPGTQLVVSIRSLTLGLAGGHDGGEFGSGGGGNDYMETEAVLVDGRGRELRRTTILSPVPASELGPWSPEQDRQRLASLATHNAGWIRRYIQ